MEKLPAIVADIDGVITRGENVIPGVKEALEKVFTGVEVNGEHRQIPFSLLTNGGSYTEKRRTEKMNDMIGLKEPLQLSEGKVVQGHTALKDK